MNCSTLLVVQEHCTELTYVNTEMQMKCCGVYRPADGLAVDRTASERVAAMTKWRFVITLFALGVKPIVFDVAGCRLCYSTPELMMMNCRQIVDKSMTFLLIAASEIVSQCPCVFVCVLVSGVSVSCSFIPEAWC
jgi:hypothetical protein